MLGGPAACLRTQEIHQEGGSGQLQGPKWGEPYGSVSPFQPPEAHYGDFDLAFQSKLRILIKSAVKGLLGISIKCLSNNTVGSKLSQNCD